MINYKIEKEPEMKFSDFRAFQKLCKCYHMTKSSFTCFLRHFMLPPVMKMIDLRRSLDGFQFRWLKIMPGFIFRFNHLKATLIFIKHCIFMWLVKSVLLINIF